MRLKSPDKSKEGDKTSWRGTQPFQNISPLASPSSGGSSTMASNSNSTNSKKLERCIRGHPIRFMDIKVVGNWTLRNIAMAGKLLRKPPLPVQFHDEDEMRKVYSLIYDVFRYKHVLLEALMDIGFFACYPQLKPDDSRVWLLLFELYIRHFLKRHPDETDLQDLIYREADLEDISSCLWDHRVKLAAAISRLRIKNGALQLSYLLPAHLKDEKVTIAVSNPIISGWINPFKLKDITLVDEMLEKLGLEEARVDENGVEQPLQKDQYKWDRLCPLFVTCMPNDRCKFAQSDLIRKKYFVVQDRTFSIAPAILSRLLDHFDLEGDVVQTHVSSPRSTAYLAALFYSINRINSFLAFGTGSNHFEYKNYMKLLGITNVRLFPDGFSTIPANSEMLEMVVGIFATPPNSFSGIADPIDLICSRGGDLHMLEILTESNISLGNKRRITNLLQEQKETLHLALSHRQVQFVLYETHSIVGSENQDMVEKAIEDFNQLSYEKYLSLFKEQKQLEELATLKSTSTPTRSVCRSATEHRGKSASENAARTRKCKSDRKKNISGLTERTRLNSSSSSFTSFPSSCIKSSKSCDGSKTDGVRVPRTEEYIIAEIPDICLNNEGNLNLTSLGCYVSLLHRKQITKLDVKYLKRIAECKKLLTNSNQRNSKIKSSRYQGKDDDDIKTHRVRKTFVVERLNRPTHASINRFQNTLSDDKKFQYSTESGNTVCTRHRHHIDECCESSPYMTSMHLDSRAKRWWQDTAHYIYNLRLLERRKRKIKSRFENETRTESLPVTPSYINNDNSTTRNALFENHLRAGRVHEKKKPFPVTVNHLEFRGFGALENGHLNFLSHYPALEKTASIQIAHRPITSRKPLGRYLLRDSQMVLSFDQLAGRIDRRVLAE